MGDCSCELCRQECAKVPGWFTPSEAKAAIEAGLAPRLSAVHEIPVVALMPAPCGHEGKEIVMSSGRCTFLTTAGMCEIHTSGFKPIECRTGFGCDRGAHGLPSVRDMHEMWSSEEGKQAVQLWREKCRP